MDVGTSGGVWGLERGYCMMIGGEPGCGASSLDPIFATPGARHRRHSADSRTREGRRHRRAGLPALRSQRRGPLRQDGPQRHRIRLMAAYAEGLGILRSANVGKQTHAVDAETTPLRDPEHYQYDLNLPDIAEVWRRGSVIASWLLDLTATALLEDPAAGEFRRPRVRLRRGPLDDQGRHRRGGAGSRCSRTALYERFSSRGEADFAEQAALGDALPVRWASRKDRR